MSESEEQHFADPHENCHASTSSQVEILFTKQSQESWRGYQMLYSPKGLNEALKAELDAQNWRRVRVRCNYPTEYYIDEYTPRKKIRTSFREMDFVKQEIGIEVQFGKYSFMVYNVAAKMTIFHKLGYINVGVEIVPVKELASRMSSGVSYFEQFVWDLQHRGTADIDIPVLIIGIASYPE